MQKPRDCPTFKGVDAKYLIYGLLDPRPEKLGQLRYVGQSATGMKRPKRHFNPSAYGQLAVPSHYWCAKLAAMQLKPEVIVLEAMTSVDELDEAETFYIGYYRMLGAELLNLRGGGRVARGYRHSSATRAKLSAAKKGAALSPSHLAAITAQCLRMAAARKGAPRSLSHRVATSRGHGIHPVIDTQTGEVYQTLAEAARATGVDKSHLTKHMKGQFKHIKGKVFRYATI